jgi:serine acetyltransferase
VTHGEVVVGIGCNVHPTAVLGYVPPGFEESVGPCVIGDGCEIGAFCVIEAGVSLGKRVRMTHHTVIAIGAIVGDGTMLVDAVRIDRRARIGRDCVIGGNVADRSVIGDSVTFMGEMAHIYSDGTEPWESTDEISPIIRDGVVVAQGAQIVGGITVGEGSYISMGEIVKSDVPPNSFVAKGLTRPLSQMRGLVKSRLGAGG